MKKRLILYILGVLIFIVIVVGITYAFMKPKVEEKEGKSNITINACAKIQLKENGNSINLKNTYPMADEMGLNTQPYEFTISSTCAEYVGFNLYLTSLNSNGIEDDKIHYAITNKNKDILKEGILASQENGKTDFNNEELKELNIGIKGEPKNIYKVYSNNIPLNDESTYQLYLWVDKEAGNEVMGKNFQVGLSVKSYNRKETFAEYLIKNKDETLIYHDGSIKDKEGNVTDAFDYSYRYAGASEEVNNFVCLDGGEYTTGACVNEDTDLYRIIGLFKNDLNLYEIKLIKYDYVTSEQLGSIGAYKGIYNGATTRYKGNKDNLASIGVYYWANSNNNVNEYQNSELRKTNLNDYYLNTYLKTIKKIDIDNLIVNHTWNLNGHSDNHVMPKVMYDNEMNKVVSNNIKTVKDKIGLIYASDYGYAGNPNDANNWTETSYSSYIAYNWMYMGMYEWTISRYSADSSDALFVNTWGDIAYEIVKSGLVIRPSFYISSKVKIKSGEGNKEKPYRLLLE